jgi:tRNA A-37 threonylcarbamoyl transferase component Bud32
MSAKEREVLTYLSPEEIEEVLKNAYGSKQYDMQRIGLENPNPALSWKENERPYRLKDIVIALSELRANYELLQSLAKVTFQGHPIAPKTYGLIYDPISKLPVGYLVEIVKGRDLLYSVKNKLINRRQMNSIQRQVLDQIQVLQALGVSHGDIVPSNIMVEIQPNGEPVARLIDYNVPLARLISNPAVVAPLFQISLRHLERDFPLSE